MTTCCQKKNNIPNNIQNNKNIINDHIINNEKKYFNGADTPAIGTGNCCVSQTVTNLAKVFGASESATGALDTIINVLPIAMGIISASSVVAAIKTAMQNHKIKQKIDKFLAIFSNENLNILFSLDENSKNKINGIMSYLKSLRKDVAFIEKVIGALSALSAALIGGGIILGFFYPIAAMPLLLAGLCTALVDDSCQMIKLFKLVQRYTQQIKEIESSNLPHKEIIIKTLKKEQNLAVNRLIGAILAAIGMCGLIFAQLATNFLLPAIIITAVSGALTYVNISGIALILIATALAMNYNPYQAFDTPKEIENLLREIEDKFKNLDVVKDINQQFEFIEEKIKKILSQIELNDKLSSKYKEILEKNLSFLRKFFYSLTQIILDICSFLTLGLASPVVNYLKDKLNTSMHNNAFKTEEEFNKLIKIILNQEDLQDLNLEVFLTQENDKYKYSDIIGNTLRLMAKHNINYEILNNYFKNLSCCEDFSQGKYTKIFDEFYTEILNKSIDYNTFKNYLNRFILNKSINAENNNKKLSRFFGHMAIKA